MTAGTSERDKMRDAILNGRDRREEIVAEWEALKMAPRTQSPEEMRRVLMTWSKGDLISALIRAESEEIKAKRIAWESESVRLNALVLPTERKQHRMGFSTHFNEWLRERLGQSMDARDIFIAGWTARARAAEAMDL